jgi:hypothetical protein
MPITTPKHIMFALKCVFIQKDVMESGLGHININNKEVDNHEFLTPKHAQFLGYCPTQVKSWSSDKNFKWYIYESVNSEDRMNGSLV